MAVTGVTLRVVSYVPSMTGLAPQPTSCPPPWPACVSSFNASVLLSVTMDECKLRMFDAKLHGAVTTCRRSCLHQRCPAPLPRVSSRRLPL